MTLNLTPLNNPDDIRREAGIAVPGTQEQAPQTVAEPDVAAVSVEPVAVPETASETATPQTAELTPPSTPVMQPIVPMSTYPGLDTIKADNVTSQQISSSQSAAFGATGYTYALPVGVYIIAAFAIAVALFLWTSILLLNARGTPIYVTAIFAIAASTLLLGKELIRWLTIAGSAVGVAYYGYYFIEAVKSYQAISSYGSMFGASGFTHMILGILLLYGAAVTSLAATCVYLLKQNVAKAFS